MSISELANSLATGANISLSSPFIMKKVTINAHPSSEAENEKPAGVITKGTFYQKPTIYSKLNIVPNTISIFDNLEIDRTPDINNFSQSSVASSGSIESYICNGYTPEEAINIVQAKRSYGINESFYRNGVYTLSTTCVDG